MFDLGKNLIIVNGKDQTENIARLSKENSTYLVTFKGQDKTYRYGQDKIIEYRNPKFYSHEECRITRDGKRIKDFTRIQLFEKHVRIFYPSEKYNTWDLSTVKIEFSSLSDQKTKGIFSYFKALAHSDTLIGDDGISILGKRFDHIDFVLEKSILSDYLGGRLINNRIPNAQTIYCPFGFNLSQKQAIENALNNRLSVIEGPPGTGKTQTILNIIANVVMRGQSVAIVSNNNSATRNVEDKLKKMSLDFIAAYLGSAENKEYFLESQKVIPDISKWKLEKEKIQKISNELDELYKSLNVKLGKKNELAALKLELETINIEQKHFLEYYTETNSEDIDFRTTRRLESRALLNLIVQSELRQKRDTTISFWRKMINFFKFGIYNVEFYTNSKERIIAICQKKFYDTRIQEVNGRISLLEDELRSFDFDNKMKYYSSLSVEFFKHKLNEKYEKQERKSYNANDLWRDSETFIRDYPVILSTTHSLRSSLSNQYMYDYVIVDEASQVNLTTGVLALSCAKRAVIVGDLKQLPNVVDSDMRIRTDNVFEAFKVPEPYRYSTHSLLLSITDLFPNVPRSMLKEHYRCNPKIINFCNQKYYDNQLIILTEDKGERMPLLAYVTAEGNHARERVNQRQIDIIKDEIIPQQKLGQGNHSIGIVTPYRNQANALQQVFSDSQIQADTVDKFQGQECDVIILSTVDNDISDFADDDHRLNVAVSRAVDQLIVVVSGNKPTRETGIGDLIKYIQYNNMSVINSEVYSVFDLLYKQYGDERRNQLSRSKKVSEYDSENLMYNLVVDVLKCEEFSKFDVLLHVPLRMIIRDLKKLQSDRESQFVMNGNTHVDFLIYDKLSHQPVLIVEVDGSSFHSEGSDQASRDKMKDEICERYSLKLERFKTTGSSEKMRLKQTIQQIVG